jgi:hypothetical protein
MKIDKSRAALRRFDKGHLGHPELPADPGTVHALVYINARGVIDVARPKEPDYIEGWHPAEAICGARVRTLLPIQFNTDDPDACPKCIQHAERWQADPDGYRNWRDKRDEKRREQRELDQALADYHERQDRDLERRKNRKPPQAG